MGWNAFSLEGFALRSLRADQYPGDDHPFKIFRCSACRGVEFEVTVEHQVGSVEGDFLGLIWGACRSCGQREILFGCTSEPWQLLREERPACECGRRAFVVAICERIEGEEGLKGFFDEGVIVGQCLRCGGNRVFVATD